MSKNPTVQLPTNGMHTGEQSTVAPTPTPSASQEYVLKDKEPIELLDIEVVKGTKEQRKNERDSYKWCEEHSMCMLPKEFEKLIKANAHFMLIRHIWDGEAFGKYYRVPDEHKLNAVVYLVNYETESSSVFDKHIDASMYVYFAKQFLLFRADIIEEVTEVFDKMWRGEMVRFRQNTIEKIKELQAAQLKEQRAAQKKAKTATKI